MIAWLAVALGNPLAEAVEKRDKGEVIRLLQAGSDPHERVERSSTHRRFNLLRRIYDTRTRETSALHLAVDAAVKGDTRMLKLLLESGVDGTQRTKSHMPPLFRAVQGGLPGTRARKLLLESVPPDSTFRQQTVLAYRPDGLDEGALVTELLAAGADANVLICDALDPGPLLEGGADPDAPCFGLPPLFRAVARQDEDAVRALAAADLQAVGVSDGVAVNPLGLAASLDWVRGVDVLIELGADPNAPAGFLGMRPLAVATGSSVTALSTQGAVRTQVLSREAWVQPPTPAEQAAYLASIAADPEMPHHHWPQLEDAGVRNRLAPVGSRAWLAYGAGLVPDELTRSFDADGCPRHQRRSELFEAFGKPETVERDGVMRTWIWDDGRVARGTGPHVVEIEGGCHDDLLGHSRGAVWLALGAAVEHGDRERRGHTWFVYREGKLAEVFRRPFHPALD